MEEIFKGKIVFLLIFFLSISLRCISQSLDKIALRAMKKDSYSITEIDSTNRYFIIKGTVNKSEPVLLVIDKKSKQLKHKNLKIGGTYIFKTYRFYDVFALDANMRHEVDGKKIWCDSENVDLRFTDGMGNNRTED